MVHNLEVVAVNIVGLVEHTADQVHDIVDPLQRVDFDIVGQVVLYIVDHVVYQQIVFVDDMDHIVVPNCAHVDMELVDLLQLQMLEGYELDPDL